MPISIETEPMNIAFETISIEFVRVSIETEPMNVAFEPISIALIIVSIETEPMKVAFGTISIAQSHRLELLQWIYHVCYSHWNYFPPQLTIHSTQ